MLYKMWVNKYYVYKPDKFNNYVQQQKKIPRVFVMKKYSKIRNLFY